MPDTGHISGLFLAHDQPGTGVAKIGPVLGRILARFCARYGLLSVRDWNGLRLGQYWDSFGPILCQYVVPYLLVFTELHMGVGLGTKWYNGPCPFCSGLKWDTKYI